MAGGGSLYDATMMTVNSPAAVAVFGHSKACPADCSLAEEVGRVLGQSGYAIVCGGYGGAMEAVSKGATQAGGQAIGVTCRAFSRQPNAYLTRTIETATLDQRVGRLLEDATAGFVVLPGGTGTLLELATCWEMKNKRFLPDRPLVCVGNFWRPLVELIAGVQPDAVPSVEFVDGPQELVRFFPSRS